MSREAWKRQLATEVNLLYSGHQRIFNRPSLIIEIREVRKSSRMKHFLYNSRTGESIESSSAQPTSLRQAIALITQLEFDHDTFFGLIRMDGKVVQFAGEGGNTDLVLVDMPAVKRKGSFQLTASRDTCREIIHEFFEGRDLRTTREFRFRRWQKK